MTGAHFIFLMAFCWLPLLTFFQAYAFNNNDDTVIQSEHYEWKTSKWSDCIVSDRVCHQQSSRGWTQPIFGHKRRRVWCVGDGLRTKHDFCTATVKGPRPYSTIVCFGYCTSGQQCLPDEWTPWSSCSACVGKQYRQRGSSDKSCMHAMHAEKEERTCFSPTLCGNSEVISQSDGGGIPEALPLRPQALTAAFVPYLHVGPWSECKPAPVADLGVHSSSDNGSKKRKNKKRKDRQRRTKRNTNFHHFGSAVSKSWPPELPSDLEISFVAESVPAPQHGTQTRTVRCRGQDGEELPFRVCVDGHSHTVVPASVRSCVVSRKCKTSQWSEWFLDVANCGGGSDHTRLKRLSRTRHIQRLPQGIHGKPCPHLQEHKQGHDDETIASVAISNSTNVCTDEFTLVASGWSECKVVDMSGNVAICGGGLQDRNISCLQSETRQPVDLSKCSHLSQMPRVQRCFVPCVDTCRLGPWSDWTPCAPKDCSSSSNGGSGGSSHLIQENAPIAGKQTRRRNVESSADTVTACPHLEESRDCSISSCHSWRLEQKDECFLPKASQQCGQGTRKLLFACVDHNGLPSPIEACSKLKMPPYEEPCHIRCPTECVVSPWTEWGACPSTCSTRGRDRRLPLVFRNRTILALGSNGTGGCHMLSEMRVCKHDTDCDAYHWQAGLWSTCMVRNGTQHCGAGTRRRDVVCVSESGVISGKEVPDWRCQGLKQPVLQETCFRPCPQDCHVTQWSEWTSCQQNCDGGPPGDSTTSTEQPSSFTVIMNTQSRYRSVLQWPQHGGKQCPRLVDVRPCPLLGGSCTTHQWKPERWSQCILPEGKTCGEGIRTRGLQCILAGAKVDMAECLKSGLVKVPTQHESCTVDCVSYCVSSPWSYWSACSTECPSERTRIRQVTNGTCHNVKRSDEESCPCGKYRSVPNGQWSQCILDSSSSDATSSSVSKTSSFCGIGKRYRRLDCLDMSNQLADPKLCGNGELYDTDSCIVICSTDCHMSPWTEWGLCDTICGAGLKNRTSKVLRLASVGGRPCPGPSVQYATCNYPCENFHWSTSAWSECNLLEKRQSLLCGRGRKTRAIRCVERTSDGLEVDVPSHYCDPEEQPDEEQDCQLFCPGECAVSEWTNWSACNSDDCLLNKVQRRNRTILRSTSQGDCIEHLKEQRACAETCFFRYEWALTAWSSCQPVGDSACGEGKRRRGVRCVRLRDNRPVRDDLCSHEDKPKNSDLETWCPTDCPVDCEVSSWSVWNDSPCGCGRRPTNMTRTRVVTTQASPTGRPCPASLVQVRPCPSVPCYRWSKSPWTCDLQGAACGHGLALRNVTCMRMGATSDSQQEDVAQCRTQQGDDDTHNSDMCLQSCPTDCVLSDWSTWSECKGKCVGLPTIGTRHRERSVVREAVRPHGQCLSELKESQPCVPETCFTYTASIVDGRVECVRSDGLIVKDGQCQNRNKGCKPECQVPNSECGPDLKCRCLRGYTPTYLPAPILSSRLPTLVFCQPPASSSSSSSSITSRLGNVAMANGTGADGLGPSVVADTNATVPFSYFPDDSQLNHWMLAMIGIGCIFIAFVGVSIYLMCKSTNQETTRVPKDQT